MKKIRFILLVSLFSLRFVASAQQALDTVQHTENSQATLNAGEIRKEKDSVAKSLTPIADKAIVYFIRNHAGEFLFPYRLDCDSFQLGWIRSGTYIYTVLDPGEHNFICTTSNTTGDGHSKVNLEPGKIYYVDVTYGIGILGEFIKLKMMDSDKGVKNLLKCNISKSNQYPLFPKSKDVEKFPPDMK